MDESAAVKPTEAENATVVLHRKLAAALHNKTEIPATLKALLNETKDGNFSEDSLKGLIRDLGVLLRPNSDSLMPIDDDTKSDSILVLAQLAQNSPSNRTIIEESGILGTSLVDLLNSPSAKIQENTACLIHYVTRSQQISLRIAKPWALNPLVALFIATDQIDILSHLVACFSNVAPMDNMNIVGKQEVIERVGYLLQKGTEICKEHAAFFICNYLARRDTVTQMIIKSGIPEIIVELLRRGVSDKAKKPLLASIGMMSDESQEVQTNVVKLGILAALVDMLHDKSQESIHELCLEVTFSLANNHDLNKMQILTAGFMHPLLGFVRDVIKDIRHAQKALRVLAALSNCKMFPSIFGIQNLELFMDATRCGDLPVVQCVVVISLNLAIADPEFRSAILSMGMVQIVKSYVERLGESKASNPVFEDFLKEMEKPPHHAAQSHQVAAGSWFSGVSNYLWASGSAISAKLGQLSIPVQVQAQAVPPQEWSVIEVCDWLNRYCFTQYLETFSNHLINGALLLDLNDNDLQELGVQDKFHRRSILKQISVLKGEKS